MKLILAKLQIQNRQTKVTSGYFQSMPSLIVARSRFKGSNLDIEDRSGDGTKKSRQDV
jgi:hypothetical protein